MSRGGRAATRGGRRRGDTTTRGLGERAVEALVGTALVALAGLLALAGGPVVLRSLLTLPVVVLVAGRAVTVMVLGDRRPALGSARRALVDEKTLRLVAPVLFGVIAMLGSILGLGLVLRVRLTETTVVVAACAVAAALHVLASLAHRTRSTRVPWRRVALQVRVVGLPALLAVLLLVAALVGARAVEAQRVERYTQLTLLDPTLYRQGSLTAAPGARFTLGWVLRGYGTSLADRPAVGLTVAGAAAGGLTTAAAPVPSDPTEATVSRAGTASALAPQSAGLYRVGLTVGDGDGARTLYVLLQVGS